MPDLGISSACFYPLTTELSFLKACEAGIKTIELFFNSHSELSDEFINNIIQLKNKYDIKVPSVHPFMSFAETFFLFSTYERRFYDIIDLYRRFFEVMQKLESEVFILHGLKEPGIIEDNVYFDRFAKLIEIGKEFNVKVCQENVVLYKSQSADYLTKMKNYIGEDFYIVLDIKQAHKANEDPYRIIDKMGERIKHVHISDYNESSPCIPPFEGLFDFNRFFDAMRKIRYNGSYIIELYSYSYNNELQIYDSYEKTKKLLIDY